MRRLFVVACSLLSTLATTSAPALAQDAPQFTAQDGVTVSVETDAKTGQTLRTVQGGYSVSADGTTITGTLPPGNGSVAAAAETDPKDPGFARRFARARNRSGLVRYSPDAARRSVVLTDRAGCVYNVLVFDWWSRYIQFNGWLTDCNYGSLHFNVWAKYFNSRDGKEADLTPRAYYGTTNCYKTKSCTGASHSADAPMFANGSRDLISRTHGWRDGGGDDTAWVYADYLNN